MQHSPNKFERKRYKLISDYPRNNLPVGLIFEFDVEAVWLILNDEYYFDCKDWPMGVASSYYFASIIDCEKYPNIFKELQWWEDRKPEDLPKYVKDLHGEIYKIKKYDDLLIYIEDTNDTIDWIGHYTPSSEKELLNEIKNISQKGESC